MGYVSFGTGHYFSALLLSLMALRLALLDQKPFRPCSFLKLKYIYSQNKNNPVVENKGPVKIVAKLKFGKSMDNL